MSIDKIKSVIAKRGGLARNNRFNVIMTPPTQAFATVDPFNLVGTLLTNKNAGVQNFIYDPRDISILCEQVTLPSRSFPTIDYQADRQSNKFPYGNIDGDITIHFIVTNDYYAKVMFDDWMSSIVDVENYQLGYKDDYAVDVVIQQLNQDDLPVYGVKLEKAYPIEVGVIALNNTDEEFVRITVTLAYDKYVVEGPISSTASAFKAAIPNRLLNGLPNKIAAAAGLPPSTEGETKARLKSVAQKAANRGLPRKIQQTRGNLNRVSQNRPKKLEDTTRRTRNRLDEVKRKFKLK